MSVNVQVPSYKVVTKTQTRQVRKKQEKKQLEQRELLLVKSLEELKAFEEHYQGGEVVPSLI